VLLLSCMTGEIGKGDTAGAIFLLALVDADR
jgi:hypothetical protein